MKSRHFPSLSPTQSPPCLSPQTYCLAPFDLIKVRLQNQTEPRMQISSSMPRYRGPVHCAASILREEGPQGLFRGSWALMLRDTPTLGIYFVTYEGLCRQYTPEGQNPSKWGEVRWGRGTAEAREGTKGGNWKMLCSSLTQPWLPLSQVQPQFWWQGALQA